MPIVCSTKKGGRGVVMSDEEYRAARELESKFQFYFTALAFTILGLAIQTAPERAPLFARIFELLAWTLLLIAGLLSLWFLEWLPIRRLTKAERDEVDAEIRARGELEGYLPQNAEQRLRPLGKVEMPELRRHRKSLIEGLEKSSKREHRKYQVARICLILGLIATAVARGYPLAQEIAGVTKSAESKLVLTAPN